MKGREAKEIEEAEGRRDLASLHPPTVGSRGTNRLLTAVHASISIVPGDNNCVCTTFCERMHVSKGVNSTLKVAKELQ